MIRKPASAALLASLLASGTVLAARVWFGPGRYVFSVHSPMNVGGIFALCFLALVLMRETPAPPRKLKLPTSGAIYTGALAILVLAGFSRYLQFPFLADDYAHIWAARHADGAALLAHFTTPEIDRFFRPAGYLSYAFDAQWAGLNPGAWRGVNLALHVVNTLLIFQLCRGARLSHFGAFMGAAIFGLHGSRPEAVTWVAARFDLLAVLFGLACVLCLLRDAHVAIAAALLAAALLSKESAYVIPFMVAMLLRYRGWSWRRITGRVAWLFVVEAVMFGYRLYLLGGIGGYRNAANGSPAILSFSFAASLKALLPRFWAALLFPINWTDRLNMPVAVALSGAVAALCYLAWRGADPRKIWLGVGLATLCSLPVHQFLSIGPDLEKSRVLYFASVGLAIVMGAIFEDVTRPVLIAAACLLGFQVLALQSNLAIWKRVGLLAGKTCSAAATVMPATVEGLPNVVDGVYFLHTGFRECVLFQKPDAALGPGYRGYTWNSATRTLDLQ